MSPTASLAVGGLLDPPLNGDRATRVYDYIGKRLTTAVRAAEVHLAAAGVVDVGLGEFYDPRAPFGEVVWQLPLPGTDQDVGFGTADLIVATRRAPSCTASQLLGRYENGGNGTGNHFGNIDILDISNRPCTLAGRLELHGLGANGRTDTATVSERIEPALILSPETTLHTLATHPAAALIATFGFAGDARDDPRARNGLCYSHETIPEVWALTLKGRYTLRIDNGAPGEGGPYFSCYGNLTVAFSPGIGLLGS